jgi:hypothetical protein
MDTETTTQPELEGEALEDEICRLAESLAESPDKPLSRLGQAAKKRLQDSWAVAVVLILTVGALTTLNLAGYGPTQHRPQIRSLAADQAKIQTMIRFVRTAIDQFHAREGRLPDRIEDLGLTRNEGVEYRRVSDTDLVITVRQGNEVAVYDTRTSVGGPQ